MTRWLPLLILLAGCAGHKPVHAAIPTKCITGAALSSQCRQISATEAVCDGVIVKFECVTFSKEKK